MVIAAQEEARTRNKKLVDHPRRNKNQFRNFAQPLAGDARTGTGHNATISRAAALVTDSLASSETASFAISERQAGSYWMAAMDQDGYSPYVASTAYKVWRNLKTDYGAYGDNLHDDTAAINKALSDGNRCGLDCGSTTTLQAVVYFPAGTYLVSGSLIRYYFTQMTGDPTNPPIIRASGSFVGLGMISSDVYIEGGSGSEW
ncbi:hypothetical protein IFR05_004466 [Cadophora sp. M221]|nr:hypothetical protein IFR05_004466 [Cadophora sp. M221]